MTEGNSRPVASQAFKPAQRQQPGKARGRSAQRAGQCHQHQPGQQAATQTPFVGAQAHHQAQHHARHLDGGKQESRLHQGHAQLLLQPGYGGRQLAHMQRGTDARSDDDP